MNDFLIQVIQLASAALIIGVGAFSIFMFLMRRKIDSHATQKIKIKKCHDTLNAVKQYLKSIPQSDVRDRNIAWIDERIEETK